MRTIGNSGFQAYRIASVLVLPLALAMTVAAAGPPSAKSSGPVVSDIIIRDNLHASSETIKNQMKTRVGKAFDEFVLQEDR